MDNNDGEHQDETMFMDSWSRQDEAPRYSIPNRVIGAVEIPMMVMNLDRAFNAFSGVRNMNDVCSDPNTLEPFD